MTRPAGGRPVRLALVTHGYDLGGGVPNVARWLRHELQATGRYSVDVLDLATSSRDRSSRRLVAPTSWIRSTVRTSYDERPWLSHWGANAVELEVMRYRRRRELTRTLAQYDIIQLVAGAPAWGAVATQAGPPVVLQVATTVAWERQSQLDAQAGPRLWWRQCMTAQSSRIEHSALLSARAVLVENARMQDYVRSVGQPSVIKAPPGIDTTVFTPRATGWRRDGHLLSVCRLDDVRKGLERMVRAYVRCLDVDTSLPSLILVGADYPPRALTVLIDSLGVTSRVTIRTNVEIGELTDLYRNASVFLQTSYEEGFGLSMLEAMSSGLPVIATETAGSRELVINGETGWLVPQHPDRDVSSTIAERVKRVLAGDGASMGNMARRRAVDQFSTTVSLQRFIDVYESAVGTC